MNHIGSLLVHIDASPRAEARMRFAQALVAQAGIDDKASGAVDVLYAATPSYQEQSYAFSEAAAAMWALFERQDAQRRSAASSLFDRLSAVTHLAMRWHELDNENAIVGTTRHALLADLIVFGQHDPNGTPAVGVPADFIESVLIDSGKPGVVVPYVGSFATVGREVLVAWKPTREAARALSASIPLLQRCEQLHVVADSGNGPDTISSGAFQSYLKSNGVNAQIHQHAALAAQSPGEGLLSLASDVRADLLVMGCYGHSRTRELVLGGATRTILRSMTLPVLMAH